MKKRQRLKRGASSNKRDRLDKLHDFEQKLGQPPVQVSESVGGKVVSVSTPYHKSLSKDSLINMMDILKVKADEVSGAVGDNWFPCGFASLHVDSNSQLSGLFKKEGVKDHNGNYAIEGVGRMYKDYPNGYSIHLDFPERNANESQSLNYKTPMYHLAQKMLAYMGVSAEVRTRVD